MWLCKCGVNNVNANKQCARPSCRNPKPETQGLDEFDELLRDTRLSRISSDAIGNPIAEWNTTSIIAACFVLNRELDRKVNMTPQEELFAKLFNHERVLVKDMDTLTRRAHREDLAKIAFEARARLTAVDEVEREEKKKNNEGKPSGFERSLNADDTATNAINTIKERQKKLSKKEQVLAGLKKLYDMTGSSQSEADINKKIEAGTILGRIQSAKGLNSSEPETKTESKPIFNPFEKKEENKQ